MPIFLVYFFSYPKFNRDRLYRKKMTSNLLAIFFFKNYYLVFFLGECIHKSTQSVIASYKASENVG